MSRVTNLVRGAAALAILAGSSACSTDAKVYGPTPADAIFTSYVAIGNSISAGYQSSGINDSTQRRAFPALLAAAMKTRYAYPSLAMPGCVPPIANFLTGARVANATSTTCAGRSASSLTDVLNNVAVPGVFVYDPVAQSTPTSNLLTNLFLGGKSQVRKALDANPTFATVWVGNNDVLIPATSGVTTANADLKVPSIPTAAAFTASYNAMIDTLVAGAPGIKGVLIGVVDVTLAPVMWPAAALQNQTFAAGISQAVGSPVVIHPNCGTLAAPSQSLISTGIIPFLRRLPPEQRVISCEKTGTPIGDYFILDSQETATVKAAVAAYNAAIQARANQIGFAYFDPNVALAQLKASGCISTVPNLASATAPYGACMSLDGAHPSSQGQVAIAEALRQVINAKYGTNLPAIQ